MRRLNKVLVVSAYTPPVVVGTAVILGNLLRFFPKGSYCILTNDFRDGKDAVDDRSTLNCPYSLIRIPRYRGNNARLMSLHIILEFLFIPLIVLKGILAISRQGTHAILGTSSEGNFLIAAYLLHKVSRLRFFVYMFDLYVEGRRSRIQKTVARVFEKHILSSAEKVFVMSESMQEHYMNKYGLQTEYLPHPVILDQFLERTDQSNRDQHEKRVVYTGECTAAQAQCLVDMANVMNLLEGVKFYVYVPKSAEQMASIGVCGPNVVVSFAKRNEIPKMQQSADILFLPLGFNTSYPDVIKTASPGKMPEYMAAGKPILIYAPSYSYISRYARRHGFGYVVDKRDIDLLKNSVKFLLNDYELKCNLIASCNKLVHVHEASKISAKLQDALGLPH